MDNAKRKVVTRKNLPYNPPIWPTIVIYLILDGLHAGPFWWGIMAVPVLLLWAFSFLIIFQVDDPVDIFAKEPNQADQ